MGPAAAVFELLVVCQLVLTGQPKVRRDKADAVQYGYGVFMYVCVLSLGLVPLADDQNTVDAVEGLRRRRHSGSESLKVDQDVLVRHYIGRGMEQAGKGDVVPGVALN